MKEQFITNFFSSRMGSATNTPPIRSAMRSVLLLFALLLGSLNVWGADDVLNQTWSAITSTDYSALDKDAPTSDAHYKGNCAGGNYSIQLRSNNSTSGIVTTTSGGKATKVAVVWNSNTASGRTLNVYGKNSAYTAATDLYNSSNQGTLLGTIVYGTSTELSISGDYEYIGFRSASGAMYLTSVTITWSTGGSQETAVFSVTKCFAHINISKIDVYSGMSQASEGIVGGCGGNAAGCRTVLLS